MVGCTTQSSETTNEASETRNKTAQAEQSELIVDLLGAENRQNWSPIEFGGQGEIVVEANRIELEFGYPLTGAKFVGDIPTDQYKIRFEARRISGSDFFAMTTFPVRDTHCSFVNGGWGGAIVGLSNVDGEDASENNTKSFLGFKNNQWYQFEIEVRWPKVVCRIDDETVVDLDATDRLIAVRPDVNICKPLSFSSFESVSEIRNVQLISIRQDTTDHE